MPSPTLQKFITQHALVLAVICLCTSHSTAQDFERYRPRTFPHSNQGSAQFGNNQNQAQGSDKVLVKRLDAVKILDSAKKVNATDAAADARGVSINFEDKTSLVYSDEFRTIVNGYIGGPISLRRLNQLSREIIQFYRKSDQPVVDVQIPEQKITGGTVQIIIVESIIGDVIMESGPYYDPDILKRWISSTYSGSKVYESSITDDLFWLNQSPFRIVGVNLKPGAEAGTTDVVFRSNEVLPWRTYIGYEDSGVRSLDLERLYTGVIWGNAFGRDGMMSYQYTGNAEFDKLHAHSASWQKAFNRDWSTQMSGSWATFSPDLGIGPLAQNGESWQVTSQLVRHLVKDRYVDTSFSIGSDFKSTNNNLEFGGVNVLATGAQLVNIRLGFRSLTRQSDTEYLLLQNDFFVGPGGGLTSEHNAAAFSTIRAATSPDYMYNRFRSQALLDMGDMQLNVRNVGQYAFDRLLFSETLGFGGYDSIRGYDQRVFSADSGWITNIELGPKPIELGTPENPGSLTFYGFFDIGKGYTRDPLPGDINDLFLMSTGMGMRLNLDPSSSLRVDYGHGMEKAPNIRTRDRIHVGFVKQFGPRPQQQAQ